VAAIVSWQIRKSALMALASGALCLLGELATTSAENVPASHDPSKDLPRETTPNNSARCPNVGPCRSAKFDL
jgi:hypothetical protein